MILTATRLTYRINRFELRAITLATLLSVVVSAAVVTWLAQSGYTTCRGDEFGNLEPRCLNLSTIGEWVLRIDRASLSLVTIFPFVAGLILGAPLVAREIDRGTARLAWSLSPSRMRWYLHRIVPVLVVLTVAAYVIGVVADRLLGAMVTDEDLSKSFYEFHGRGVLIATNALVLGSTAIAVGAIIGRPMQTLLLSLVLGGLLLTAVSEIDKKLILPTETIVDASGNYSDRNLYVDNRFQLPDGTLLTWDELVARDPSVQENGPQYPNVELVIPGDRYRQVEGREALAGLAISAVMLLAGGFVVLRRRPG
jgi:hypothetical protein